MNTNEFYKQLMEEYTFDHEKIKKAAMGKTVPMQKKTFPAKWITAAGAAVAAMALVIGVGAFVRAGTPIEVTPTTMTAEQRIRMAMEAYEQSEEMTEEVFLYVTFNNCETPADMQKILSAADNTGNIKVVTVYISDGREITGSANIQQLFEANEENIAAVKIRCPGKLFRNIIEQSEVYLVEDGDDFSLEAFSVPDTDYEYSYGDYEQSEPQDTSGTLPSDDNLPQTEAPDPVIGDSKDIV